MTLLFVSVQSEFTKPLVSPIISHTSKQKRVHLWVKFMAGEEQCKFLLCAVVTEPCPHINSPQRDRVRAWSALRRVCFNNISEWMLKSEASTFQSFFPSVFKCFDFEMLLFHFVLFCFHRFVSVWQCRVISLFTALQASFPQCSSVTERLSFFPWVKYQMAMWTNPWYFQIKFVFKKKWRRRRRRRTEIWTC